MQILRSLDEQFGRLHARSHAFLKIVPAETLYRQPRADTQNNSNLYSCGEYILRSAATVEQTFGGVNSNLWDDPFEWTLPEALPTHTHIASYLDETEETRRRSFSLFRSDDDLLKTIAIPSGELTTLFDLLTDALVKASHFQGRAFALYQLFSGAPLPRL